MADEPQNVQVQDPPEGAQPLSSSEDIFKLPLQPQVEPAQEVPTASEPPPKKPQDSPAPTAPTAEKPSAAKPTFETQPLGEEKPFKSEDAEKIRQEPVPATLKGAAAKSFGDAKTKWAGIVEAKDTQLQKVQKEHQEKLVALQQENEKLAKRVADLSGYESVIDFQAGEKFKNEFSEPLKQAEEGLVAYMQSVGATPEGIEELKRGIGDEGYLFKALAVLQKEAPTVAVRFQFELQKILGLRQRRDAELANVRKNHDKYVDERRTEGAKRTAEFEQKIRAGIEQHVKALGPDKVPQFPFLVKLRAPEGADGQTLKQVQEHNQMVEENLRDLERAVRNDDPQERVRLAVGYMTAVLQQKYIQQLHQKLAERDEHLQKVKKASAPPDNAGGATLPAAKLEFQGSLSEMVPVRGPLPRG